MAVAAAWAQQSELRWWRTGGTLPTATQSTTAGRPARGRMGGLGPLAAEWGVAFRKPSGCCRANWAGVRSAKALSSTCGGQRRRMSVGS